MVCAHVCACVCAGGWAILSTLVYGSMCRWDVSQEVSNPIFLDSTASPWVGVTSVCSPAVAETYLSVPDAPQNLTTGMSYRNVTGRKEPPRLGLGPAPGTTTELRGNQSVSGIRYGRGKDENHHPPSLTSCAWVHVPVLFVLSPSFFLSSVFLSVSPLLSPSPSRLLKIPHLFGSRKVRLCSCWVWLTATPCSAELGLEGTDPESLPALSIWGPGTAPHRR